MYLRIRNIKKARTRTLLLFFARQSPTLLLCVPLVFIHGHPFFFLSLSLSLSFIFPTILQVALLVRFTCGEDDPPFLPDSLQDDPYTAKLKHKSLLALAQHNFAVFNTEVLPMSGGKVYEGEVYSAAYVASAFSNSNGSGGGNVGNINGSGGGGNDLSGHYGNTMSGSSGSSGSSSSSSGAGSGGGSSNVVDKTPHGQGVLRYPPPRGALEGANGDVYAGG